MSNLKSTLLLSLVDKVTGPARAISATMQRLNQAAARNAAAMDRVRSQMVDAVGVGYLIARSVAAPIKASVAFEEKLADIAKVADGLSPAGLKAMGDEIRKLSLRIPIAADGLADIVANAAQSGISNSDLLGFTEMAAKVATAWDVSASEAGESLAKLKTALGRTVEDTALLADAINHLSNRTAASAPQILDVVKRVAPMAKQFGMTAEQVAALAATMTGAGFESEVAATSILNIGKALTKGGSATKRQSDAFKKLGLTSKNVAKAMQKDSIGTLQDVLARISKIPAESRAALVSDLFGDEARALGPLISNGKLLADTMALIGDKSQYAGSAQAEFDARSRTTGNALKLFGNRLRDLSISVGDALAPGLNKAMDVIGPFVTKISDLAQKFPEVTAAIVTSTAALVALRVAMLALRFSGLFMAGSLIAAASGFVSLTAVLGTITGVLTAVGGAIAAISAPVWLGIAVAVGLVAAAGAALWRYWDRITAVVSGVATAIGTKLEPVFKQLQPVLDAIRPVIDAVGSAFKTIADGVGNAWSKLKEFASGLSGMFSQEILTEADKNRISASAFDMTTRIIDAFAALPAKTFEVGSRMIQSIRDGAIAKVEELLAWLRELPSKIIAAIGNIDLSNVIKWPSMPSWLGGTPAASSDAKPATTPEVDGARARGGPVTAGKTYLIGEKGPELFSPDRSGMVSPNEAYRSARAASTAPVGGDRTTGPVTVHVGGITVSGVSDPRAAAAETASQLGARVKTAVESLNSD